MFKRLIEPVLKKTVKQFPVTVLTGPRQSGKTTLLKYLFPEYRYISLESPDHLLRVQSDPRGFLESSNEPWIIDEAQHYPELFSYIQEYVDAQHRPGQFILSGSQNFLLAEKISQSLAGRAAILELLPLSYPEYQSTLHEKELTLWEYLFHGSYPRPYYEHLDTELWYSSYIRTYLERDVRSLINVKDLSRFQLFLKLCAGRHGQLLNLSALAQECGIAQTTATQWLSILEASYIIFRLRPHHRNFNKRLVKTPKLYFYDSAIVCMLLGINSSRELELHNSRGAIFEGFVLSELMKHYYARGKQAPLYFWRDQAGMEVDGLLEHGNKLHAIEIKSGMTVTPDMLRSLSRWKSMADLDAGKSWLIYAGREQYKQKEIHVLPWNAIENVLGGMN